jgi:hypothetical protein
MKLFYIETGHGCGLRRGRTLKSVHRTALREAGAYAGVQRVRVATAKDIAWVTAMGGYTPPKGKS